MSDEKRIGSSGDRSNPGHGFSDNAFIPGSVEHPQQPPEIADKRAETLEGRISIATEEGGLKEIPSNFEDQKGDWTTYSSANPFQVLYLDYKQYRSISPAVIENNYNVILQFWRTKSRGFAGGARELLKKKYGEDALTKAVGFIEQAYQKLTQPDGIALYYKEVDKKRYSDGIKTVTPFINGILDAGMVKKTHERRINDLLVTVDLSKKEVTDHLLEAIQAHQPPFKPRARVLSGNVFEDDWRTDEVPIQTPTTVNNRSVRNLAEYGEVLLDDIGFAIKHLQDSSILTANITILENGDDAMFYRDVANEERDIHKRVLKVIYWLNDSLPFTFAMLPLGSQSERFGSLEELLKSGFEDYGIYRDIEESFHNGYLQIWLEQTDKKNASKLPVGSRDVDFITFLYRIDPYYPFYLNSDLINTPFELVDGLNNSTDYWIPTAEYLANNLLPTWFMGIGRNDWNIAYNERVNQLLQTGRYTDEELPQAAIQELMHVIKTDLEKPRLEADVKEITLRGLEASPDPFETMFTVNIATPGYAKAFFYLDPNIHGISLIQDRHTYFHQGNERQLNVRLRIETLKLNKGEPYKFNLTIRTLYQTIQVPVVVEVVFPTKSVGRMVAKYAAVFGGFMAVLAFFTRQNRFGAEMNYIFFEYGFYAFVIFILWYYWWSIAIKKIEKL